MPSVYIGFYLWQYFLLRFLGDLSSCCISFFLNLLAPAQRLHRWLISAAGATQKTVVASVWMPNFKRCVMGIIAWIVFGLIAGYVASLLMNRNGEGVLGDILLGVVGSVVGGFIAGLFGLPGVYAFNPWSFLVAIGGAVVTLAIYHAVVHRPSPRI